MSVHESRWKVGNTIGRLTVALVLGRRLIRPGKAKMWVYRCVCECDRVQEFTQEQLVGGRIDCTYCMKKRLRTPAANKVQRPKDLPPEVPDFSRLPVPETIKKLMREA